MRVVIAEDSAILRDGLVQLLGLRGVEVAAAVGDAEALHAAVAEHEPDAAVIDIRLPPDQSDEGLRAAVAIRRTRPEVGVLIFSQYVETRYAADLLADSATGVGYLLKERVMDIGEFVDALRRVAAGGTALDPEVVSQLLSTSRRGSVLDTLTPREGEVLSRMAQGLTNSAIAEGFVVSERAVEKHVANIFTKLGLSPEESGRHRRVLAVLHYLNS
ncbi:LuxR C-terminal-related transcriptional regulator [Streptomyces oceani]|uniref:LuxR family transcriptional regulator n=1 Tax=Streptomyces oceani TaxID=1075402 RepID=A0A1E7KNA5_9ACTN|nr:response regulator transcription factor [Streptomyces oceani]OEV05462.1 LuxR family transcriptional regulator [Streptomyces oceani]